MLAIHEYRTIKIHSHVTGVTERIQLGTISKIIYCPLNIIYTNVGSFTTKPTILPVIENNFRPVTGYGLPVSDTDFGGLKKVI